MNLSVGNTVVFKDVNLALQKGKIVGLVGPKSFEKSTLLKLLGGFVGGYSGEITIDGLKIGKLTKSIVSFLPKVNFLDRWMSTISVYNLYRNTFSDFDEECFLELLAKFDVDPRKHIKKMTVAMKNHFQFALIMSRRAKVFLLDEPMSSIGSNHRDELVRIIKEKSASDSLVIISSESLDEFRPVLDTLIFIKEGKVVLFEDVQSILIKEDKTILQLINEVFIC
jgi:ABC-2 type transport system ATP-binding protein